MSSVLAFDLWGDYGHYRKIYTTTSPLTYSIPPRTALVGLLGAIMGFGKDEYLCYLSKSNARIAVRVLNKIRKITVAENLIDTKAAGRMMNRIRNRTQIKMELLKEPKYRVYVSLDNETHQENLYDKLRRHQSIYTPCLGLSEHIANFRYVDRYEAEEMENVSTEVVTAIPRPLILEMMFEEGKEYIEETMPVEMSPDRVVREYTPIVVEQSGKPIKSRVVGCSKLDNGEYITFL